MSSVFHFSALGVVHYLVEVALPLIFHLMLRFLFFLQRRRWRWRQRPQISHRWRGNHNPNFIPTVKRNMVVNILFHVQCLNWALAIRSIVLSKQSFLKPPLESGRFLCLRQSWPGIGLKCIYLSIDELRDRDNQSTSVSFNRILCQIVIYNVVLTWLLSHFT